MTFDPEHPSKLDARGWGTKKPSSYRVWLFLGVSAAVAGALIYLLG